MNNFFRQPFQDILACLERLIDPTRRRQSPAVMFVVLGSLVVTWFIYVPIHELLHVGGCVWTGGEVTRLELSPRYGARWLQHVFPFISTGSDYAGQLTGFDTRGSDWCYFVTVFAPFALTVLLGVPLIKLAGRSRRPLLFGVAIVVGLAPFYNVPGDYYEMGSILTTRTLTAVVGEEPAPIPTDPPLSDRNDPTPTNDDAVAKSVSTGVVPESPGDTRPAYAGIRSDDIYLLVGTLIEAPSKLGLTTPGRIVVGSVLILVSMVVDVFLAFATYWVGHHFANLILPRRKPQAQVVRV